MKTILTPLCLSHTDMNTQQWFSCWHSCYHGDCGLPGSLGYSSALEVRAWLSLWGFEVADSAPEESFLYLVKGHNMSMGTLNALQVSHTHGSRRRGRKSLKFCPQVVCPHFSQLLDQDMMKQAGPQYPISQGVPSIRPFSRISFLCFSPLRVVTDLRFFWKLELHF